MGDILREGGVTVGGATPAPTSIDIGDTAVVGASGFAADASHIHSVPAPGAGYPLDVDETAEADGTATTPARSDHRHFLGSHTHTAHANRTRELILGAGNFTLRAGVPALAVQGTNTRYRAWALDAGTTETILTEFLLPVERLTGALTVVIYWTNLGAGAGNVVWTTSIRDLVNGADLNATAFSQTVNDTIAAPAQDVLKVSNTTITFNPAVDSTAILHLSIGRVGGDAADTLANDAGLLAIKIQYTADS